MEEAPRGESNIGHDDLAGQLADAQAALSATIIELRQSGGGMDLVSQGELQLASLMSLKRQLETASPAALAGIRAQVASCIAAAARLSQQALEATSSGAQGVTGMSLFAASEAARAAAISFEDDYYTKRKFEAYLHFSSPDDEAEFRRREAERKAEIDKALAQNSPQGNLLALRLEKAQLQDAGLHGATASPEYGETLAKLDARTNDLASALSTPKVSAEKAPPEKVDAQDPIAALRAAGVELASNNEAPKTVPNHSGKQGSTVALH